MAGQKAQLLIIFNKEERFMSTSRISAALKAVGGVLVMPASMLATTYLADEGKNLTWSFPGNSSDCEMSDLKKEIKTAYSKTNLSLNLCVSSGSGLYYVASFLDCYRHLD